MAERHTDTPLDEAYRTLRALHVVDTAGWARYEGADTAARHHLLKVSQRGHRVLRPDEVLWWARGLADARGEGDRVWGLSEEPTPPLLTLEEAAALLPAVNWWNGSIKSQTMTADGVVRLVDKANLYVVYGQHQRRHLFHAQVEAVAAERRHRADPTPASQKTAAAAMGRWQRIAALLPPQQRARVAADVGVGGRPPIRGDWPTRDRQLKALQTGEAGQGWLRFDFDPTADGYTVTIDNMPRDVPAGGVLPYVLGVADRHGKGRLVAYRQGLG